MKSIGVTAVALCLATAIAQAQKPSSPPDPTPRSKPKVPIVVAAPTPPAASDETFFYEQRPVTQRPYLVTPEQAQAVIDQFKDAYQALGSPRILIYVNRELVDEDSGLKLSARREEVQSGKGRFRREFRAAEGSSAPEAAGSTPSVSGSVVLGDVTSSAPERPGEGETSGEYARAVQKNTYRIREREKASLADRQTVRDIERLFGRPLRMAGANLVDQRVATQLIADRPLESFAVPTEGEQARKDREALQKVADVVLEILVSSKEVVSRQISGDKTYTVPDIQATAIRLSDSSIIGQATSADLLGPTHQAGRLARLHEVREMVEATALSLMEDITLSAPAPSDK